MRISDWSSDVCSSDLTSSPRLQYPPASARGQCARPRPCGSGFRPPPLRRQGRVGEGCFLGSARTVDTPSQPPPAFAGGGATAKLAAEAAPQDQERDRASGYPRERISNPRRTEIGRAPV